MKKNWEIKKLGDLVTQINGLWKGKKEPFINVAVIRNTNFSKDCKLKLDDVEYLDVELKQYSSRKLQGGDIIIEKSGGSDKQPVGRPILFNIEDGEYSFSNFTSTLRIKDLLQVSAEYLQQYLYFRWLNGDTRNLQSHTTGIHNLDFKAYLNFDIILPPLEEQKRIVKILDEKFAQLETIKTNAQTNLENAKDLFQSQLTKAFSNTTWEKKRLGDAFYVKSGGTPSRSKKEYWNGDIPWYSSGELGNRYTTNSERNINSLAIDNSNAKLFPKGSLLIGMYDTAAMKMSILDRDATFNQAIAGVKPCEEYNLQFIRLYLDSIKTEMFELRRGTRQKNLSLEKIKEIKIPLPPLPEQKRIVKELDTLSEKVRQLQEIYTKQIANCDELKQSYLQKAFEGELD